ncbi:MAG: hypothetical protein KatS3mg078_1295 [Deltaproteobacteria bacterium]|nr:MAG: hypothetical protein KatS3mg078_1295 [Deltaproteobacteria bacterium]
MFFIVLSFVTEAILYFLFAFFLKLVYRARFLDALNLELLPIFFISHMVLASVIYFVVFRADINKNGFRRTLITLGAFLIIPNLLLISSKSFFYCMF